ncbi:UDP-glucose dehydrogenase family protein [Mucisphaera sp.]|uniref:UDP-glucose dehydrogenase family protein n=1 Tax=Mucisphaera sp. TaxID=2913024 RepID=UPI003D130D48
MRITMVGTGYVGLVTGTCLSNTGNDVVCLDVDPAKIDRLNRGESPIYEPGLDDLIERNAKAGRLNFTLDKQAAYGSAEAIFICVGTPSDENGRADLKYVLAAARDIGDAIEAAEGPTGMGSGVEKAKIVIVKSTVPVGTNAKVRAEISARTKKPFLMASNPEFLKEGAAIHDFNRPDRVVLGVDSEDAGRRLRDLYTPFVRQGNPIFVMDIPSAEMVKYASNAMLATKISFINEIAGLCESYGANVDEVRRGMCSDKRIGNQFLYPGLGYGGSCFPKDVLACVSMGEEAGRPTQLLSAVHRVNQHQRTLFMDKVDRHFGGGDGPADMKGVKVAVWGIAFKPGTDDIREAPSITVMEAMLQRGAEIVAHDPVAHETAKQVMGDRISYASSATEAIKGVDALVISTDWDEFKHPDFGRMRELMRTPVVFDGRNLYSPAAMREAGFVYHSVGREAVTG